MFLPGITAFLNIYQTDNLLALNNIADSCTANHKTSLNKKVDQ